MRTKPTLIAVILLLNLCVSASDNPYFTELLTRINENIEAEAYQRNLEALPRFVREEDFRALNCYQQGKIFHKIGVSYYLLDREEEAIGCYRDSVLARWRNCPGVPASERANTIYNIGICYQYLGNSQQAKKHLDDALFIFENDPAYPAFDLAKKYQGIANFYRDNFDYFRAGLYYENALSIFRQLDETESWRFDILNSLLILCINFKKYDKARACFQEALALHRAFPESISNYDLSILYQNAGIYHFELGELDDAMEKTRSGLALIKASEEPILYANAIEKIAMINGKKERFPQAIDGLNEVVRIRSARLTNAESYQYLAYAYENLFELYRRMGDLVCAGEFLRKAFETLMINGVYDEDGVPLVGPSLTINDLDLVRLLSLKAELYKNEYAHNRNPVVLKKSLALYYRIDTLISKNLLFFQFQNSKLNFLELIQNYYGAAIEDALRLHQLTGNQSYLQPAYFFSSKTKAIVLRNELKEAEVFQSVASPDMIEREKVLVQKMFRIQEQLAEEDTNKDLLLRQYVEAQRELDIFLRKIEQDEPEYYQKKYASLTPPRIDAIQALLPKNLAVVEYFYRADTIYSFWITRDLFTQIPVSNDDNLKQAIKTFVDQCHNPALSLSLEISHFLYKRLLGEGLNIAGENITRLSVIPDGILHTIPFEALNSAGAEQTEYLIERYSVAYSYSVGLLFRKKNRSFDIPYVGFGAEYSPGLSRKLKGRRLLLGDENLARLVLAQEEITRANTIFSGKSFLGKQATLNNFYEYSTNARIIHLSLHGLVDFDDPLRSSILFDDHQEAFVLSASDLYSHKINADLVVLSACHSADGKIYFGEGVQGMSKAFMLSGAQSILSSLWSASEASSLRIMNAFFRNIRDETPKDLALHQAKLDYLSTERPSQRHPFYWANAILIGGFAPHQQVTFPIGQIAVALIVIAGVLLFLSKTGFFSPYLSVGKK